MSTGVGDTISPSVLAAGEWLSLPDGRELYLERDGQGGPTVVLEAGMGSSRNMWGAVAPGIAAHAPVVVYDRSGLGRSPRDHGRRNLAQLTDDLLCLLDYLGAGPFILVGHSWGGPVVRCAAARRPKQIAGLVLIDQTDEDCDLFFSPAAERQTRMSRWLLPLLARLGVLRMIVGRLARQLPAGAARAMRGEDGTLAAVRALLAELEHHVEDLRRLRETPETPQPPPQVPVTVISGMQSSWLERGRRESLVAVHRARAAALPRGRHVEACRSGHMVPFTEPRLVVAEVCRILSSL